MCGIGRNLLYKLAMLSFIAAINKIFHVILLCLLPSIGLCPRCSDKLNYGHKRKDVSKELKKLRAEVDMIEGNQT